MTIDLSDTSSRRRLHILVVSLALIPVWAAHYIPMVDLPIAVARIGILAQYASDPAFQQLYTIDYAPIPNLAFDLFFWLAREMEPNTAAKIFISAFIILISIGIELLSRQFRRREHGLQAIFAVLLIYNSQFFYGFINYFFSFGLFLITLALWMKYQGNLTLTRGFSLVLLSLATYISHLAGYAMLVSFCGIAALLGKPRLQETSLTKRLASLIILLGPVILFLSFMRGEGSNSGMQFNGIKDKLIGLASPFVSYNSIFDVLIWAIPTLVVIIVSLRGRVLKLDKDAMIFAGCALLLYLITPAVLFTSYGADVRIVPLFYIFFVLSVSAVTSREPEASKIAWVLLVCGVVRVSVILGYWMTDSKRIDTLLAHAELVPNGSSIFPLLNRGEGRMEQKRNRAFLHVLEYAIPTKRLLVHSFIARSGQQPLVYRPQVKHVHEAYEQASSAMDWSVMSDADYVWAFNESASERSGLELRYMLVNRSVDASIYRTR